MICKVFEKGYIPWGKNIHSHIWVWICLSGDCLFLGQRLPVRSAPAPFSVLVSLAQDKSVIFVIHIILFVFLIPPCLSALHLENLSNVRLHLWLSPAVWNLLSAFSADFSSVADFGSWCSAFQQAVSFEVFLVSYWKLRTDISSHFP